MKVYYYIFIAIGISFLSCQTNDDFEEITSTTQNENRLRADENDFTNSNLNSNILILENNLEWVSYLITEALVFSTDAQDEFTKIINNTSNLNGIILLNKLFDEDQDNTAFLLVFEERFWCFEDEQNNCAANGGRPQGRVNPGELNSTNCEDAYCDFLNFILIRNCIEIYLPNGINFSSNILQVISTAHPLNNDLFNDVYIHESSHVNAGIVFNNGEGIPGPINPLPLTHYELNDLQNIIVARPYRNDSNCTYDGYINDFTVFLGY